MTRILFALVVLFAPSGASAADDPKIEEANQAKAVLGAKAILQACEAYQNNPANQKNAYPTILLELVKSPFGGVSYLRNGEKDLFDPWGKMYQYAVAPSEKGNLRAYVWTERTVDKKTTVIGNKPPEPKKK